MCVDELGPFFAQFKQLVEDNYNDNGYESSMLVCHSMGCLITTQFLRAQSQAWKNKYVKSLVTLGGPWGGSIKALKAFTSGDNLGVIVIPDLSIRQAERTFPGLTYLMPRKSFWPADQVLMTEPEGNYTTNNFGQLFNRLQLSDALQMYIDMEPYINDFEPPNGKFGLKSHLLVQKIFIYKIHFLKSNKVELHCLHGYGQPTIDHLEYGKGFPDASPKTTMGAGDGTVNLISLQGCQRWQGNQNQAIFYKNFSGVEHMSMLSNKDIIDYVVSLTNS